MKDRGIATWLVMGTLLVLVLNLPLPLSRQLKSAVREGLAPLHELVTSWSSRLGDAGSAIRGWGGTAAENRLLAEKVVNLEHRVRELEALETRNVALRAELQFARRFPKALIPAEVIARDISGWWQTVRLGKGQLDGLQTQMAVVTAEGLIGKIVEVSPRTAEVLLISDPSCRVSCSLPDENAFGVLQGKGERWRGSAPCRLDLIDKDAKVREGSEVVTSGLGGVFPEGLLVGYVDAVESHEGGLYLQADVVPRAQLSALQVVFVVVNAGPLQVLREEAP